MDLNKINKVLQSKEAAFSRQKEGKMQRAALSYSKITEEKQEGLEAFLELEPDGLYDYLQNPEGRAIVQNLMKWDERLFTTKFEGQDAAGEPVVSYFFEYCDFSTIEGVDEPTRATKEQVDNLILEAIDTFDEEEEPEEYAIMEAAFQDLLGDGNDEGDEGEDDGKDETPTKETPTPRKARNTRNNQDGGQFFTRSDGTKVRKGRSRMSKEERAEHFKMLQEKHNSANEMHLPKVGVEVVQIVSVRTDETGDRKSGGQYENNRKWISFRRAKKNSPLETTSVPESFYNNAPKKLQAQLQPVFNNPKLESGSGDPVYVQLELHQTVSYIANGETFTTWPMKDGDTIIHVPHEQTSLRFGKVSDDPDGFASGQFTVLPTHIGKEMFDQAMRADEESAATHQKIATARALKQNETLGESDAWKEIANDPEALFANVIAGKIELNALTMAKIKKVYGEEFMTDLREGYKMQQELNQLRLSDGSNSEE